MDPASSATQAALIHVGNDPTAVGQTEAGSVESARQIVGEATESPNNKVPNETPISPPETVPVDSSSPESDLKLSEENKEILERLNVLNTYFAEDGLDMFTHFAHLTVQEVAEIAILNLLGQTVGELLAKFQTSEERFKPRTLQAVFNCMVILKQSAENTDRLLSEEFTFVTANPPFTQFTTSFSKEFAIIALDINLKIGICDLIFLNNIIECGKFKSNLQIHTFASAKEEASRDKYVEFVETKFMNNFTLLSGGLNGWYKFLAKIDTFSDNISENLTKLRGCLPSAGGKQSSKAKPKSVTIDLVTDGVTTDWNIMRVTFKDCSVESTRLRISSLENLKKIFLEFDALIEEGRGRIKYLILNCCVPSEWLIAFYTMNAKMASFQQSFAAKRDDLLSKYTRVDPFATYLKEVLKNCEYRIVGYSTASYVFMYRFFPMLRLLCKNVEGDWRDLIEFDYANPAARAPEIISELEREIDEKVKDSDPSSAPTASVAAKKKKKKPKKKTDGTTHNPKASKAVFAQADAMIRIATEGRKVPPIIEELYRLKSKIDSSTGVSLLSLPVELAGKRLSRSVKAKTNQSYALHLSAVTAEMLQYSHCYDANGEYNHMGKTLIRFAALQTSLATEQGMTAQIYASNPWQALLHNQAIHVSVLNKDSRHPAIKQRGRETLVYRFPTSVEAERKEVMEQWPRLLSETIDFIAPAQSQVRDPVTLPKLSSEIAVRMTSEQTRKLNELESQLRSLAQETQKMDSLRHDEKRKALVIIRKHLDGIRGFVQTLPFFCHQAFAVVPANGIYLSAQTLLQYAWVLTLLNRGRTNVLAMQREDNYHHQINHHIDSGELGAELNDSEKLILRSLHAIKAFEYLPGHCVEREAHEIGELPTLLSDLVGLSSVAEDTKKPWAYQDKPRIGTEEEVAARLTFFIDRTTTILNVVCKLVRQLLTKT